MTLRHTYPGTVILIDYQGIHVRNDSPKAPTYAQNFRFTEHQIDQSVSIGDKGTIEYHHEDGKGRHFFVKTVT